MPALLLITSVQHKHKKKVGRELEQTESKGQRASAANNQGLLGMKLSSRFNKALGDLGSLQECSQKKTIPQRVWWV